MNVTMSYKHRLVARHISVVVVVVSCNVFTVYVTRKKI